MVKGRPTPPARAQFHRSLIIGEAGQFPGRLDQLADAGVRVFLAA